MNRETRAFFPTRVYRTSAAFAAAVMVPAQQEVEAGQRRSAMSTTLERWIAAGGKTSRQTSGFF